MFRFIFNSLNNIKHRPSKITSFNKSFHNRLLSFERLEPRELLDGENPITWTGGAGNLYWSYPANWDLGRTPVSGDDVKILLNNKATRYNLDTYPTLHSIEFGDGSSITSIDSRTIYIGGSGCNITANGAVATINAPVYLYNNVEMFATSPSPGLKLEGNISGSGGITKTGSGFLTLSGSYTNTGAITISDGTVSLGASNVLSNSTVVSINGATSTLSIGTYSDTVAGVQLVNGYITGTTGTLTSTSTYDVQSGTISAKLGGSVGLTKSGSGILTFANSSAHTYTGETTITGGTLQIGNGGANGTFGTGSVNNNGAILYNRAGIFTLSNRIYGTGSFEIINGLLTLSSANTFSGGTTINGGQLQFSSNDRLSTSGAITISNGNLYLGTYPEFREFRGQHT